MIGGLPARAQPNATCEPGELRKPSKPVSSSVKTDVIILVPNPWVGSGKNLMR